MQEVAKNVKGGKIFSISYTYVRQITDSLNSRDEILVQKNDLDLHVLESSSSKEDWSGYILKFIH